MINRERIGGVKLPEPVYGGFIRTSGGGATRLKLESSNDLYILSEIGPSGSVLKRERESVVLLMHDKKEKGIAFINGNDLEVIEPDICVMTKIGTHNVTITANNQHGIRLNGEEPTEVTSHILHTRFD